MKKFKSHSKFTFILLAVMILGLMGAQHAFAKKMKFTMQTMFSMNHPITVATTQMIEKLKKETNGEIAIQMLPPGALVKGPNIFESVAMGSIDMGITCSSYHSSILPMAATSFALPGDPRGMKEILDFMYQPKVQKFMRDAYAAKNVFFGAPMVMDGYTIVSKKPIETWEDLNKMKVRASGTIAKALRKMNIPTVFIPFSEIYVALSRGTIDAEISGNHTESFLAKTFEVAKFQTDPSISGAQNCEIIVNLKKWNKLPENYRTLFDKALHECALKVAELFEKQNKENMEIMASKGTQFLKLPDEVMNKWVKNAVEMWDNELSPDKLSAEYIALVKEDLKKLGYNL